MRSTRPDFVMGNTRLRARRAELLDAARLARLADRDLAGLTADLRATPYGRHLEPRAHGDNEQRTMLLSAVEDRRRDALRGVREVYTGAAGEVVGILLARYDLADTVTLLRGAARGVGGDDVLGGIEAVAALDPATVSDLVADDPESVVARLAHARLPDPHTAQVIPAAWEQFLVHGDLPTLEITVARAAHHRWREVLGGRGRWVGRSVEALVRWLDGERDAANLLVALRSRSGRVDETTLRERLLAPGEISQDALLAIASGADPVPRAPRAWRSVLARSGESGDLASLARELAARQNALARHRMRHGDPLGVDVPIAFVAEVETEAEALRRAVTLARLTTPTPTPTPTPRTQPGTDTLTTGGEVAA